MLVFDAYEPEKPKEEQVQVSMRIIADSGYWDKYCEKYGMNPWAINEGADPSDTVSVDISDFKRWLTNE